MASSDDYSRELERLLRDTEHKAEWARELTAKDTIDDLQRRRKAVGWRFSEFVDAFLKDPQGAIKELERLEQRHQQNRGR